MGKNILFFERRNYEKHHQNTRVRDDTRTCSRCIQVRSMKNLQAALSSISSQSLLNEKSTVKSQPREDEQRMTLLAPT